MFNTRGVQITWLGHAAFRMRSGGKTFYIDPFLAPNPKCPEGEKNPSAADAILLSHGHFDHISDAAPLAQRSGATVAAIVELGAYLQYKGVRQEQLISMNIGGTAAVAGAKVTMVPALHSSSAEENGLPVYLGEPAGFVVEFQEGLRIYFAGDTAVFGDMSLIAELYQPEVAFLPIGDFYTMGPDQAALACRLLRVKRAVPMHYGTFPALTGTPEEFRRRLAGSGCEVAEMQPGETIG